MYSTTYQNDRFIKEFFGRIEVFFGQKDCVGRLSYFFLNFSAFVLGSY